MRIRYTIRKAVTITIWKKESNRNVLLTIALTSPEGAKGEGVQSVLNDAVD